MIVEKFSGISELNTADKLRLVGELWNDIALHKEELSVPETLIAELDQRMAEYENNPSQTSTTWETTKARIIRSRK